MNDDTEDQEYPQEEYPLAEEKNPVETSPQIETDVNESLEKSLQALEAKDPLEFSQQEPAAIEPPDVGQLMEDTFDDVQSKIEPPEDFSGESEEPPPAEKLGLEIQPPGSEVTIEDTPETLLDHFKNLLEDGKIPKQPDEDLVSLPSVAAEYEAESGGYQTSDGPARTLMDSDARSRDSMSWMLIDHARRIDEITERMERVRL